MNNYKIKRVIKNFLKNKYLTYFIALFTLFFITEVLNNPSNNIIVFLKVLFSNNLFKLLFIMVIVIIGYVNINMALLLLLNFFFIINIQNKIETFANKLPDLINKNDVLKYKRFTDTTNTNNTNNTNKDKPEKNESNSKPKPKTIDDIRMKEQYDKNVIKNPIKKEYYEINENRDEEIKETKTRNNETLDDVNENMEELKSDSHEIEFGDKKNKNINNKDSLKKFLKKKNFKKKKKKLLLDELKQLEEDEDKELNDKIHKDDTIETELKSRKFEKQQNLEILENEKEDEESSSSNSSDTSESESSDSSSDSNKEYEDVSLTEAREHVLKKLRNKLKKKYAKG